MSRRYDERTRGGAKYETESLRLYAPLELAFFKSGLPKEFLAHDASLPARMRYFDGKDPDVLRLVIDSTRLVLARSCSCHDNS